MGTDSTSGPCAQTVGEAFGQRFHPGLADVVGGVAGRLRDALFGAGVDDEGRGLAFDHARDEGLDAVDHAHQVDAEHLVPL